MQHIGLAETQPISVSPVVLQRPSGATDVQLASTVRNEEGWNTFLGTAAWWLGEHANVLTNEYVGREPLEPAGSLAPQSPGNEALDAHMADVGVDAEPAASASPTPARPGLASVATGALGTSKAAGVQAWLRQSQRNPAMSQILSSLQVLLLTGVWTLRLAAAHALAKLAMRTGEPFRAQCYSILKMSTGAGMDSPGSADYLGAFHVHP